MANSRFPSGGGGGTPAGSNTQIQYNDSGAFGASSLMTFADFGGGAFAALFGTAAGATGGVQIQNDDPKILAVGLSDDVGLAISAKGAGQVSLSSNGSIALSTPRFYSPNLPTSDPVSFGDWWVDTGAGNVVKVSQG